MGDQTSAEVELDETTWFDGLVERVNELGAAADPGEKYSAGKLLAEKAAWEFMEQNKGSLSFDLTTLHPCLVSPSTRQPKVIEKPLTAFPLSRLGV